MCMLFGFTAKKEYELSSTLRKFYNFSYYHPHGWGLAAYGHTYRDPQLYKEPLAAYKSNFLNHLINNKIVSRLAIAHIRYATVGEKYYNNTHPFINCINGRQWIFAHNGSVDVFDEDLSGFEPNGSTDSERVFCLLAGELNKLGDSHTVQDEIECIEHFIRKFSQKGKLNLLITDGERLYIHTNYKHSLYMYESGDMACFSTKVQQLHKWKSVDMNKLLVYSEGKKVYEGIRHSNEYIKE